MTRQQGLEYINFRIQCLASRASIQTKKFKYKKNKQLVELQQILIVIFQLQGIMTKFRFFYQGKQIHRLDDIPNLNNYFKDQKNKQTQLPSPIQLRIQAIGG